MGCSSPINELLIPIDPFLSHPLFAGIWQPAHTPFHLFIVSIVPKGDDHFLRPAAYVWNAMQSHTCAMLGARVWRVILGMMQGQGAI